MSSTFRLWIDGSPIGKPKKISIQATPHTLLSTIRQQAVEQLVTNTQEDDNNSAQSSSAFFQLYSPMHRKYLDLGLPLRLANLTPNSLLELRVASDSSVHRNTTNKKDHHNRVSVAIQCRNESGKRWTIQATQQDTLQSILDKIQDKEEIYPKKNAVPILYYVHQPIRNLKNTRLQDLGISKGSVLFSLDWETKDEEEEETSGDKEQLVVQQPSHSTISETRMTDEENNNNKNNEEKDIVTSTETSQSQCIITDEPLQWLLQNNILESGRLRVYRPSNRNLDPNAVELPESFYEFTLDDLHTWKAEHEKRQWESQLLLTKEQRRALRSSSNNSGSFSSDNNNNNCTIRIKLPDGIYIQLWMDGKDTCTSVYRYLDALLLPRYRECYYLFTSPPPRRWLDRTQDVELHHFRPGITLYLGGVEQRFAADILQPEILQYVENSPLEQVVEKEEKKAQEIREQWTREEEEETNNDKMKNNSKDKSTSSRTIPRWWKPFVSSASQKKKKKEEEHQN
ncbi:hypothetical protein GAYE_SCF47G5886 [Galdieria yellowstonensis]|uniref:UBX domain-containing protein n=1 Tax=Galdieria yellowstonensis TaxID=3028027 RepID=A0AAV9IKI4_9RHOD|nr:hypothetical protein GAYE_SCF47G5886 [Galdieria yellowstonensis]